MYIFRPMYSYMYIHVTMQRSLISALNKPFVKLLSLFQQVAQVVEQIRKVITGLLNSTGPLGNFFSSISANHPVYSIKFVSYNTQHILRN